MLIQDNSLFKSLFTIRFTRGPEKYFVKLFSTCSLTKFQGISKFTGPNPINPHTFLYRINTSVVKIRPVLKNS